MAYSAAVYNNARLECQLTNVMRSILISNEAENISSCSISKVKQWLDGYHKRFPKKGLIRRKYKTNQSIIIGFSHFDHVSDKATLKEYGRYNTSNKSQV